MTLSNRAQTRLAGSAALWLIAALAIGAPVVTTAQDAAPARAAQTTTGAPAGDATRGRDLYYQYACYACHGYTGETGARPFVGNPSPVLTAEATFIRFLRGRATVSPELPSTAMPSYAERTLSDAQARDIYAHIRTFTSHAPPLEEIGVLQGILDRASPR